MIGENGTPETPDWSPCVGNLCAGCGDSSNLCKCSKAVTDKPCCGACSHNRAGARDVTYPIAYYGD